MKTTASNANTVINYQDKFLSYLSEKKEQVTVYLVNGFQIRGVVEQYDNFTIIISSEGKQQLIYKHAVSTITPSRPVPLK